MDAIAQIRADMEAAGITQPELAKALGKSFDSVNRLLSGRRKLMAEEADRIREIIARRNTSYGSQESDQPGASRVSDILTHYSAATPTGMVPLYGFSISNGGATLRLDAPSKVGVVPAHPFQSLVERGFAVEVVDETMVPRFEPGEIVYGVRGLAPRRGQDVVVELQDGGAMIRRFVSMDTGSITVEQHVPAKKTTWRINEVRHLHAVVGSGRR